MDEFNAASALSSESQKFQRGDNLHSDSPICEDLAIIESFPVALNLSLNRPPEGVILFRKSFTAGCLFIIPRNVLLSGAFRPPPARRERTRANRVDLPKGKKQKESKKKKKKKKETEEKGEKGRESREKKEKVREGRKREKRRTFRSRHPARRDN